MATLANTYRIIDDYDPGSNPVTPLSPGAGGTGQPLCADFVAPTIGAAMQVAAIICTALQRPGRLVPLSAPGPYTLVIAGAPLTVLTQVPSGITY